MGGKIELDSDATHFQCESCKSIKRVKDGVYKAKTAYGCNLKSTQNNIRFYVGWVLLCKDCYFGKKEETNEKEI